MAAKHTPLKIATGSYYIRRRDKALIQIDRVSGQLAEYHGLKPVLTVHKVSLEGFRKGFRMLTEEEKNRHASYLADDSAPADTSQ